MAKKKMLFATEDEFKAYIELRDKGIINMLEWEKGSKMANICPSHYRDIIERFSWYQKEYPNVKSEVTSSDKSVESKVIIEEGLEDNSQTQLLSDIYRRLEEYNNLFPKANFMMLSTNEQDKMGIGFILGDTESLAKELVRLIQNKDEGIRIAFSDFVNKLFSILYDLSKEG